MHPRVKELLEIPQYPQRSDEWFEQRRKMLTSSDVDTVLGRNPYAKRDEVLFKKCGLAKPFTGNIATRHGQAYENEAIQLYCQLYGKETKTFGLLPHRTIPFLGGSPDDITTDGIVIEVKCPLHRKIKMGEVPKHYWGQIQLNLEICDLDHAVFIEYRPAHMCNNNEYILNIVNIERDREWFQGIYPALKSFWDEVCQYREIGIDKHPKYPIYKQIIDTEEEKLKNQAKLSICLDDCYIISDVSDSDSESENDS